MSCLDIVISKHNGKAIQMGPPFDGHLGSAGSPCYRLSIMIWIGRISRIYNISSNKFRQAYF